MANDVVATGLLVTQQSQLVDRPIGGVSPATSRSRGYQNQQGVSSSSRERMDLLRIDLVTPSSTVDGGGNQSLLTAMLGGPQHLCEITKLPILCEHCKACQVERVVLDTR